MRFFKHSLLLLLLGSSAPAFADELSLLSGLFRSQEDDPGFKRQEISIGGRYGFEIDQEARTNWFLEARIASVSFSGDNPPDDSTDITAGAGQVHYFRKFAKGIQSYLSWFAGVRSSSSADVGTKTESTGLVYAGNAGFRFDFSKTVFLDLEANLFTSALQETTKTTTTATGVETESKRTELFADTFSGVDSLRFGVGMYF